MKRKIYCLKGHRIFDSSETVVEVVDVDTSCKDVSFEIYCKRCHKPYAIRINPAIKK